MSSISYVKEWLPVLCAPASDHPKSKSHHYAVLILNQPLENKDVLVSMCGAACYIVCADGGANRLKEFQDLLEAESPQYKPNAIVGDLDSAYREVLDYYRAQGVNIVQDKDQYSTDLTKCLRHIDKEAPRLTQTPLDIVIVGGLGGRADQAFSQLHHLYTAPETLRSPLVGDIFLVTAEAVIFLLEKGLNRIHVPASPGFFTENVGIIPLGRPSIITTRGLEWDVADWPTEFGGQISTSNHVKSSIVEIDTSERVLFTMEFDQGRGSDVSNA